MTGVNADALLAYLKSEPVKIPKLFPTNAHADNEITFINKKVPNLSNCKKVIENPIMK